jgi:hypothetical protein
VIFWLLVLLLAACAVAPPPVLVKPPGKDSPTYEQVKQDVDAIQAGMDTPHPDKGAEYVKPVH